MHNHSLVGEASNELINKGISANLLLRLRVRAINSDNMLSCSVNFELDSLASLPCCSTTDWSFYNLAAKLVPLASLAVFSLRGDSKTMEFIVYCVGKLFGEPAFSTWDSLAFSNKMSNCSIR